VNENEYFENNMRLNRYTLKRNMDKLRKPPDKYRSVASFIALMFSISGYCVCKDSLVYSSFTFNFIADHVLMSVQTSELCHKITMLFCKFIIGMVRCLSVSLSHTHTSFGVFAAVGPAGRRY